MKRICYFLAMIALLGTLSSCTTTKPFLADYTLDESVPLDEKLVHYGGVAVSVNEPEMYFDGVEWAQRMVELVEGSNDYILISTFLGSYCDTLAPLYEALQRKAEEGVRIYYIYDGISEEDMTDTRFYMTSPNYLRQYGVKVLNYSPLTFTHMQRISPFVIRDHRKLMVFDGKTAVIGGMNINYISMGAGEKSQRDSMYVFASPSLASLLADEFVSIWNDSSIDTLDSAAFARYEDHSSSYRAWLFNRNVYDNEVSLSGMYGSLIAEAEESIFLCPYLPLLDKKMAQSLKRVSDKGVDVTIVNSHDSRGYANQGYCYAVDRLVNETGATVYDVTYAEDGSDLPMFHLKMLVVDDRYVVFGSSNFNFRTMALSHEICLVIDSKEMAAEAKAKAVASGKNLVYISPEEAKRMKKEQGNLFAYLFSFFGG